MGIHSYTAMRCWYFNSFGVGLLGFAGFLVVWFFRFFFEMGVFKVCLNDLRSSKEVFSICTGGIYGLLTLWIFSCWSDALLLSDLIFF